MKCIILMDSMNFKEIRIEEIERLRDSRVNTNIFLSQDYSPFQTGQTFYHIIDGFAVDKIENLSVKEVLIKAMQLKSLELSDYKKLLECK